MGRFYFLALFVISLFSFEVKASEASLRRQVLEEAYSHLGQEYVWNQNGPRQFDCSGFVQYTLRTVLGAYGFDLPYSLSRMPGYSKQSIYYRDYLAKKGARISCSSAREADVVFFSTNGAGDHPHIGIVVDPRRGTFITAQSRKTGVQVQGYGKGSYWAQLYPECYRNLWVNH